MGELGMMYGHYYDEYMDYVDVCEDDEYKMEMRTRHPTKARTQKKYDEYCQSFDENDYME